MPSNVAAMPLTVRWYRNRGRCLLIYGGAALGPIALAYLLIFTKNGLSWVVLGALAIGVAIWQVTGAALAGFGVSSDALIVRSPLGTSHRVPWAQVASFNVSRPGQSERSESVVVAVRTDGHLLHTGGCTFGPGAKGHSRAEAMAAELNTDRVARSAADAPASLALRSRAAHRSPGTLNTPERAHTVHTAVGIVFAVLVLGAALYALVATIGVLGPTLRATHDQGVRGSFVAVTEYCGHSCSWHGNFVLPDGTVTLRNVEFNAYTGSLSAGQSVPALDSGYSGMVFPVNDSTQWIGEVVGLVISAACVVVGVVLIVVLTRRELRMRGFHRSLLSTTG